MTEQNQSLALSPEFSSEIALINQVGAIIAGAGMYGIKNSSQAIVLMALVVEQDKPITSVMQLLAACGRAMRSYHIVDGKPSKRSDAMQSEFEQAGGAILFHVRTDDMVAGTAFKDAKKLDDKARERATKRFELLWQFECLNKEERLGSKGTKLTTEIAKLAIDGEETVIRTYADAEEKGLTKANDGGIKANWRRTPKAMLTARFITEVVRLLAAHLIVGFMEESEARDVAEDAKRIPQRPEEIQALIDDAREKAVKSDDPEERRRYAAIAAELQIELDNRISELDNRVSSILSKREPEAKPVPLEVVREVDPGHPTLENKAPEGTPEPEKTEKRASKPKKEDKQAPATSETGPSTASVPESGTTATKRAAGPPGGEEWPSHEVKYISLSGVKGMKLGDISPDNIKRCKVRWVDKYAAEIAKDEGKKAEALAFLAAFRHHFPQE
jgi:hypothetical protein